MNIDHMQEFLVLARTLNFLDAAEELFISISTLSKHISKLESELGVRLFDRSSRHMYLSKEGSVFKDFAERIVKQYDICTKAVASCAQNNDYKLTVGFSEEVAHFGIFELLTVFKFEHPEIEFEMTEYKSEDDLYALLASKRCDFFFRAGLTEDPELESLLYITDPLTCVVWAGHPLAKRDYVTVSNLKNEDFILYNKHLETQAFMDLCFNAGITPNVLIQLTYSTAIMRLVEQKVGITILSRQRALSHNISNLSIIDIQPAWNFDIYLHSLKKKHKTYAENVFEEFVCEHI